MGRDVSRSAELNSAAELHSASAPVAVWLTSPGSPAECNSAAQQIINLRYRVGAKRP